MTAPTNPSPSPSHPTPSISNSGPVCLFVMNPSSTQPISHSHYYFSRVRSPSASARLARHPPPRLLTMIRRPSETLPPLQLKMSREGRTQVPARKCLFSLQRQGQPQQQQQRQRRQQAIPHHPPSKLHTPKTPQYNADPQPTSLFSRPTPRFQTPVTPPS